MMGVVLNLSKGSVRRWAGGREAHELPGVRV